VDHLIATSANPQLCLTDLLHQVRIAPAEPVAVARVEDANTSGEAVSPHLVAIAHRQNSV